MGFFLADDPLTKCFRSVDLNKRAHFKLLRRLLVTLAAFRKLGSPAEMAVYGPVIKQGWRHMSSMLKTVSIVFDIIVHIQEIWTSYEARLSTYQSSKFFEQIC